VVDAKTTQHVGASKQDPFVDLACYAVTEKKSKRKEKSKTLLSSPFVKRVPPCDIRCGHESFLQRHKLFPYLDRERCNELDLYRWVASNVFGDAKIHTCLCQKFTCWSG